MLGPLILFQRLLHREIQAVFLLITRRAEVALVVFSILFFPGVLLHELSHYIMALVLRIQTGRFSLIPRNLGNGRLQLGYVETAKTDFLRDALIGLAPLLTGGLFVGYAGNARLRLLAVWEAVMSGDLGTIVTAVQTTLAQPDFWLWFYLTVVISSTMLPSPSDRRAWVPLGIAIILLVGAGILVGIGPWMLANLVGALSEVLGSTAVVFGMSAGTHLAVLLPVWVMRHGLSRITGMEVTRAQG
jgi:hypothetical protein